MEKEYKPGTLSIGTYTISLLVEDELMFFYKIRDGQTDGNSKLHYQQSYNFDDRYVTIIK